MTRPDLTSSLLAPIAPPRPVRAVVFTGPSLGLDEARRALPGAEVRPPIRRGDLPAAVAEGFDVIAMIDGTYVIERTVSAGEVLAALATGAIVYGAASIGALRAVELRGAGMVGVGVVYDWYLRGLVVRDDEVVVGMDPDSFAARNEPLINLRYALQRACGAGILDGATAGDLLGRYAAYHFSERSYARLLRDARRELARARDADRTSAQLDAFAAFVVIRGAELDLKRRDARALLRHIDDAHLLA